MDDFTPAQLSPSISSFLTAKVKEKAYKFGLDQIIMSGKSFKNDVCRKTRWWTAFRQIAIRVIASLRDMR